MDYSFWVNMHSGIRWLVVLAFILVLLKYGLGVMQNSQYGAIDKRLMSVYSLLAIVQWVIGLGVIIAATGVYQNRPAVQWLHMLIMTLAVGLIASTSGRTRRAEGDSTKFRTGLIGTVVSAIVILIGITVIGGW